MSTTVDSLDIKITAEAQQAEAALDSLVAKLNQVHSNLKKTTNETKKSGNEAKKSADKTAESAEKSRNATEKVTNSIKKQQSAFTKLSSLVGKFYQRYFLVIRAIKQLWKSVETTADYVEAYNYFNVALEKIGSDWAHEYTKYSEKLGVKSAEEYAESFKTRLQSSLDGLSGLRIEIDAEGKGLLTASGLKSLGLNIQEVTQYASQLASVTNSVGQTGEVSLATASAFTKLGADMSSLFNVDYSSVMKNLQSGLIGQSRALYKYGIDITNATLQTYAYQLGVKKSVSEMTQAEKMQLRMVAILDQSKVSWGDLANTIASPSNMIRQFKNNLKEMAMTLGQLFLPVLQKVMPFVNGLTIAFKNLFATIAGFFGVKIDLEAFGQGYSDLEEDAYDAADGVDDLTASMKKLKTATLGIDELNINAPNDDSGSNIASGSSFDLTEEILKATEEYQKVWQEAYDKMEETVQRWAERIEKAIEPIKTLFENISIGDWIGVGKDTSRIASALFDFIGAAIAKVDWYKLGRKVGDFFVGIDWTRIFASVGKAMFEALKALIETSAGMFSVAPIETALISLFSLAKVFKTLTASKIIKNLTSLKSGIKGLISSMTTLQKGTLSVIAIFGEFFALRDGFYNITMGADDLIGTLGKIVTSAGLASAALYASFGPAGLAIAAVTGLVAAISGIDRALQDKMEIEIYGQELDSFLESLSQRTDVIKESVSSTNEYIEEAGLAEMGAISKLADEYFNLSEKEALTNDEKNRMLGLANLLVDKLPSLQQYYNEETGLIDATRESVESLIDARLTEIKINAMSDKLTEIYKNQQEAAEQASIAMQAHMASQEEMEKRMNEANYTYWADKLDYSSQLSKLREELKNATGDTTALQEEIQKVYNLLTDDGANPQWDDYATLSWAYEQAVGNVEAFKDEYKKTLEVWQNADAVYVEATKAWDKYSGMLADAMSGAAENAIAGYTNSVESDTSIPTVTYDAMREGVLAAEEALDIHSPSRVYAEIGSYAMDGFALGVRESAERTSKEVVQIGNKIINAFTTEVKKTKQVGVELVNGIINGLTSMEETLYKKVSEIGNNMSEALRIALDIHSPSKVMFEIGSFTMQGLKDGIENAYKPIILSMRNFGLELPSYTPLSVDSSYSNGVRSGLIESAENSYSESRSYAETNELLKVQNGLLEQLLEKELKIGDKQIAQANMRGKKLIGASLIV